MTNLVGACLAMLMMVIARVCETKAQTAWQKRGCWVVFGLSGAWLLALILIDMPARSTGTAATKSVHEYGTIIFSLAAMAIAAVQGIRTTNKRQRTGAWLIFAISGISVVLSLVTVLQILPRHYHGS